MTIDRRQFHSIAALAFGGLASACSARSSPVGGASGAAGGAAGYGPLVEDPGAIIDLPRGFSYRILSSLGERMSDGFAVPDRADGMDCIRLDADRMALVRNHELGAHHQATGPYGETAPAGVAAYDSRSDTGQPLPGGTSTIVYNGRTGQVEAQYLSLVGTIRNCAGGVTPWGTWLTCEEDVTRASGGERAPVRRDHGWVFEVPAAHRGLADPVPLIALGRRNHEAACVDPRTGIVYQTEDRPDSLFYRLLPNQPGRLVAGGKLQALAMVERDRTDSRNWTSAASAAMAVGGWHAARWIDMDGVEAPDDDLRMRGAAAGAMLFARGEGIHWGRDELYFTCTNGGPGRFGQVMRYRPSRAEGQVGERDAPGQLQLFVESAAADTMDYADNLTVAANGHLMICEDRSGAGKTNHLRGVTPDGMVYPFGRIRIDTEPAGICFSPDGRTMFVNIYSPTKTLAITGPWLGSGRA
jgi:uncharacterized protein